ncbi:caspase family protein [Actinomadura madurae]|nr:caspase family protein [Actinomadura madurae]MCP9980630.1 caspase family protein [Actinomadura madurae]MCQ0007856.1 caspase family protein [Actinomadura madurae]MCQ0016830.1 caspase family protein [Actinomadura madurae]
MWRGSREQQPRGSRRLALLVASDRYQDPGLSSLRSPAHDTEALAAALAEPRIGSFEVERVFNKAAHEVNAAIEDFFCDKRPDDVLLLYVSCHGVKDDAGRLYFATTNTRVKRLGSTGIASTFVSEQMTQSMSRNIILLLDCCYSGAFVEGLVRRGGSSVGINERLSGSGRAILSSSSALEYAFELDESHKTKDITAVGGTDDLRPSVFTGALVQGLTTGEADRNHDGLVSIDELYEYTYSTVTAANRAQTPTKFSDVSGELIVAFSPDTAEPPSLPTEVMSAVEHPLSSVRLASVDTLRALAQSKDDSGWLARQQLTVLLGDDSRAVAAKASEVLADIDREEHLAAPSYPPGDKTTPPSLPGEKTSGSGTRSVGSASLEPSTTEPSPVAVLNRSESVNGVTVLAYLLPCFTSLLLLRSRSRLIRYHAVQSALISALTLVYFFIIFIIFGIYVEAKYDSGQVPGDDVFVSSLIGSCLLLPCALRVYCLIRLARTEMPRIHLLGRLAHRLIYKT